jgi:predicted transposase YbfD/YdcC
LSRISIPSTKLVVKKHLERTVKIQWSKVLNDPRSSINMKWNFDYLMNMTFYGMLTGQKTLRHVEDFSENYHERISDSTLYVLLSKIDPEPLRKLVSKEVKRALHDHELPKDYFPVRITAIDGKCASVSNQSVGSFSQESACNDTVQYVNRVLRAAHVSNETKLVLGQLEIHGKTNETKEFIPFVKSLLSLYGKTDLLEVISVDAGMISCDNASFLKKNGLEYIMALKNPQKKLVEMGRELLGNRKNCDEITTEHSNGKTITRQLYRCDAPAYPKWPHLKQFWRIVQESHNKGKITIEERYFITSLEYGKLNHKQVLQAIRMHWGIENNANWVFDTAWKEDNCPWCNQAFILITLLRVFAYNIISRLKSRRLRQKNDRERSWAGIMSMVNTILIEMRVENKMEAFLSACND